MKLHVVVPCYNEEAVLPESARRFDELLDRLIRSQKISPDSKVTFVDDGSTDRTWALVEQEARARHRVGGIRLARNHGHQNAVLAGMMVVDGDAIVTIDADLQDDPDAIEQMVDEHLAGCDIVYGVRADRSTDSAFKRNTALFFYRLLAFFGVRHVHNHADFRLMSRRAIETLREFKEVNLYLRGIVPLIGFRSSCVAYDRRERFAGTSKYPLRKMVRLAVEAITSFSTVPLQIITLMGFVLFFGSLALAGWALWTALLTPRAVPGWASLVTATAFFGGIQILCLGILGSYLGRIYAEVKARPRFVIDRTIGLGSRDLPLAQETGRSALHER